MLAERHSDHELDELATGTSFTVHYAGNRFLITNKHNLTGMDGKGNYLSSSGIQPSHVRISAWNRLFDNYGPVRVTLPLYRDTVQLLGPLWLCHPLHPEYDVVALPIDPHIGYEGEGYTLGFSGRVASSQLEVSYHDWKLPEPDGENQARPYLRPGDGVSVVGFPFGLKTRNHFPIWINGTIATEPEFNYDSNPIFLIDARTRSGQSGSPVVLHLTPNSTGTLFTDWSVRTYTREVGFLLGVYSGRVESNESDLGMVWKASVIREILNGATAGD